jgi:hypothetical protein
MKKDDIIKVLNKELDKKAKERSVSVLEFQKYEKKNDGDIAKIAMITKQKV